MIYYNALIILIVFLYIGICYNKEKKEKKYKIFCLVSCIAVVLFQGFRSFSVGTDLASYLPAYSRIGALSTSDFTFMNYEIGYVILNKVLFNLGLTERQFLIVVAMLVQIPIFYTIAQYSKQPLISVLWYFAFGNFLMTFSGLRQAISMGIAMGAYKFVREKKPIQFVLLIILAGTFHKSALFCLLIYPIYFMKLDKRKIVIIATVLISMFLARAKIFAIMSEIYYGESQMTTETGAYTMFAIYTAIYIFTLIKSKKDTDFQGLRNILLLLVAVYMFASIHNYVARIGFSLTLYMTIFIPEVVNIVKVKPRHVYIAGIVIVLILSFNHLVGMLNTLPFSFG